MIGGARFGTLIGLRSALPTSSCGEEAAPDDWAGPGRGNPVSASAGRACAGATDLNEGAWRASPCTANNLARRSRTARLSRSFVR